MTSGRRSASRRADAGAPGRARTRTGWSAWDALSDVDALVIPSDLATALEADPAAARGFEALSTSMKRQLLLWVSSAKRPETRDRRILEFRRYVAVGRSPLEWPRRPLEE